MKKTIMITCSVLVLLVGAVLCCYFVMTAPFYTGAFSISDYSEQIECEYFHTDQTYGKIDDYQSAAKAGKAAISDRFEDSDGNLFKWMGCHVKYDAVNDVYYIRTFRVNVLVLGGAYDVILKSDGTVLAIWGEK